MRHSKGRQGFTLIEIIIVCLIVAVLATIGVVALVNYIDNARANHCAANRQAAEELLKFELLKDETLEADVQEDIIADAGVECPAHAKYIVTTSDASSSVTCEEHGGGSALTSFRYDQHLSNIRNWLLNTKLNNTIYRLDGFRVDSTSESGPRTTLVNQYFSENGLFLSSEYNIKSWSIDAKNANSAYLYWTEVAIKECKVGDYVLVMRYNEKAKTFTVGYMRVAVTKSTEYGDYNTLDYVGGGDRFYELTDIPQTGETKRDFDKTKEIYNQARKLGVVLTEAQKDEYTK